MKKLLRTGNRFKGFSLGLDLHKKFIQYALLDRKGNEIEAGRIEAQREALLGLVRRIRQMGLVQASLEACGIFVWVFDVLAEALGRQQVQVAHPINLRGVMRCGEKSDAADAWWLGYLLWEGRLPKAFVAEGALRDLRIAGRELRSYTNARSDLLRRLRSHLAQAGISLPANWQASKQKKERAREVLRGVTGERGTAVRILYREIAGMTQVMKHWNKRVEELSAGFAMLDTIKREIPGVKAVVGGLGYGELGDPRRYYGPRAYAQATGLTPSNRSSGGKREAATISREGRALARWAYTRAVIACLRCKRGPGAQVGAWVRARSAYKPKRKVIVAAGRKLAEGVWRLGAWGEAFNLMKAFPAKRDRGPGQSAESSIRSAKEPTREQKEEQRLPAGK